MSINNDNLVEDRNFNIIVNKNLLMNQNEEEKLSKTSSNVSSKSRKEFQNKNNFDNFIIKNGKIKHK